LLAQCPDQGGGALNAHLFPRNPAHYRDMTAVSRLWDAATEEYDNSYYSDHRIPVDKI
jgi:hypothetical protein